jgi:hypothetical protein
MQQRREERRQIQLDEIQQQIESGKLVVRKMTAEEREKFPPRPPKKTKQPRR